MRSGTHTVPGPYPSHCKPYDIPIVNNRCYRCTTALRAAHLSVPHTV